MKRVLLLGIILAGLLAGTAQAQTAITCADACSLPYQQWVDESLMPTPDVTLTLVETDVATACPTLELTAACTDPSAEAIWFAPASDLPPRRTFWHELGHNVDVDLLAPWMRERFMGLLGLTGEWHLPGNPEPYGPDEEFADAYAQCALKPYLTRKEASALGAAPFWGAEAIGGRAMHNKICRMVGSL
jgi:hypothetical protein